MNDYGKAIKLIIEIEKLLDEVDECADLVEDTKLSILDGEMITSSPLDTIRDTLNDVVKYITYKYGQHMMLVPDGALAAWRDNHGNNRKAERKYISEGDISGLSEKVLSQLQAWTEGHSNNKQEPEDGEGLL